MAWIAVATNSGVAQDGSLDDPAWLAEFVDEQFAPITDRGKPGFGVAIIQGGKPIFLKGYGLADMEAEVPVTTRSRFYIASMSKQFTAAIIAQLIEEGHIDLKSRIRQLLPELPPAYGDVSVADLLFHTGGVREYTSMMLIRGDDVRLQGRMNTDDAYRLIRNQQALDFRPGTEYSYSSSGYVILAKLIEAIEQKPFHEVAAARIFAPLGMRNTLFDSDHSAVIRCRAKSYQYNSEADEWRRWLKHFDVVGDGGVLVTVEDMALWDTELSSGATFGAAWLKLMQSTGYQRDGSTLFYGFGLWHGELGGHDVIAHGGGMGGFIADQIRVPTLDLSFYVFANRNDAQAFQGWKLAKRVLDAIGETSEAPAVQDLTSQKDDRVMAASNSHWLGAYFADGINNRYFLREDEGGRMVLHDGGDRWIADLAIEDEHTFRTIPDHGLLMLDQRSAKRAFTLRRKNRDIIARRYDPTPPKTIKEVAAFTGSFWSDELESLVSFYVDQDKYFMRYAQGEKEQLFPVPSASNITWNARDKVWTGRTMVKFRYSETGLVTHVDIGDGRVKNIRFIKLKASNPVYLQPSVKH